MQEGTALALAAVLGIASLCGPQGGCTASRPARTPGAACSAWTYDEGGVVRGDTATPKIALIFTGGDYGEGTAHILDVLQHAGIQGSFFVTGQYLARPEHTAYVRRMVAEGHYVGPHSDGHLLYCAWEERAKTLVTAEIFKQDLAKNIAELRQLGGLAPGAPLYFIPPYEWFNADQVRWAREMNITLFNFTPGSGSNRDWIPEGQPGFVPSTEILADILAYEQRDPHGLRGFLLLLHLGSQRQDKMHAQIGALIDELAQRGYSFERVDALLAPRAP